MVGLVAAPQQWITPRRTHRNPVIKHFFFRGLASNISSSRAAKAVAAIPRRFSCTTFHTVKLYHGSAFHAHDPVSTNQSRCRVVASQSRFVLLNRAMAQTQNPFLLAADNSPALLPLLREDPALASAQDEHGYSLVHAAASYNHIDLLRALVFEFHVDVDLKDEDNETALFVVETVDAARVLVEELSADVGHKSSEGLTAAEKFEAEGDFPAVTAYLMRLGSSNIEASEPAASTAVPSIMSPPPIEGMDFTVGTLDQTVDIPSEVDPEFRRRIEELAQRDDFDTQQGQADLRKLVEDALIDQGLGEERHVRPKYT